MEKIYIIGHKSPDLDSVAAAISYANFKNILEQTDKYIPARAGDLNRETKYLLEKLQLNEPELLSGAEEKNLILVDHNEFSQAVEGIEEAKIQEILDHHKVNFQYSEPIYFTVKPWGASCSIIAQMYFDAGIEIDKSLASLMLGAVLVDTVITKSPTCTDKDKEIIKQLAELAGIDDWKDYGLEIFKVRSSVSELSAAEIIKSDYKDFNFKAGKFGIGQVETVDLNEFDNRREEIIEELEKIRKEGGYHTVILFITDIMKEGSLFLVATQDPESIEKALDTKLENNQIYLDGVISRKKQVAPKLTQFFDN